MTALTREEENEKLAEWLGWKFIPHAIVDGSYHSDYWLKSDGSRYYDNGKPPDFFRSEEASALLLEKMLSLDYQVIMDRYPGTFELTLRKSKYTGSTVGGVDRKTAIALAALSLIEKESHDH